jgi:hypothetical protein
MMKKRGRGQSWSLDIILAFVIFVLIIGIFYTLLNNNRTVKTEHLQLEANTIANNLDTSTGLNSTFSVMQKGTIDKAKLQQLYNSTYSSLKYQFGIKGDFCIYIVDQYGNLITVPDASDPSKQYVGYGNGNFSINGKACGSIV